MCFVGTVLFLCIQCAFANSYTDSYNRYINGEIQNLVLPDTFLGDNDSTKYNPCEKTSGTQYRTLIEKSGMKCSGQWCNSTGGYGCPSGTNTECYNAIHIISPTTSLSEFPKEYNRDILGNYIMGYGLWRSQLSGMKNWANEKFEKQDVIGKNIFEIASQNVMRCSGTPKPTPSPTKIIIPTPPPTPATFKHTVTYNEWKQGTFAHDNFFQRSAYLGYSSNIDPCTSMSKDKYIRLLKDNGVGCTGRWCIDEEWKCRVGDNQECYNLEHIIDKQNSNVEFGDKFNKDIVGNYIFAYGRWNQEIGRMKDWPSIKNEKIEVYGNDIFSKAYRSVRECSDPDILLQSDSNEGYGIVEPISIAILGLSIFIITKTLDRRNKIEMEEGNLEEGDVSPTPNEMYENIDGVLEHTEGNECTEGTEGTHTNNEGEGTTIQ
jgi:hypothetical protein